MNLNDLKRCGNCKNGTQEYESFHCKLGNRYVDCTDFCHFGNKWEWDGFEADPVCYLCGDPAKYDEGVLYYRFYDVNTDDFVDESICKFCLTKLSGKV